MPTIPSYNKCGELGCTNPKSKLNRFCLEHGGKDVRYEAPTKERREFNSMYQTPMWQSARRRQLSKQPLCACCLSKGIITSATHIDHVFPWSYIGKEAFFNNLFQSLCLECHSYKTSLEAKGIMRYFREHGATDYSLSDYARIVKT